MKDKTVKQRIERIANEYGTIDKDLLMLELEALVTHAKLESLQEPECTLDPYCKCEDCKDYNGELPIDRV